MSADTAAPAPRPSHESEQVLPPMLADRGPCSDCAMSMEDCAFVVAGRVCCDRCEHPKAGRGFSLRTDAEVAQHAALKAKVEAALSGRVLTPEEQARKTHEECEMHAGPLFHDWTYHLPKSGRGLSSAEGAYASGANRRLTPEEVVAKAIHWYGANPQADASAAEVIVAALRDAGYYLIDGED